MLSFISASARRPLWSRSFAAQVLNIYHGSHTGTATNFAGNLSLFGKMHNLETEVHPLSLQSLQTLAKQGPTKAVFVTSTYGNGEFPSVAQSAFVWLQKTKPDLSHLTFSIFGLGNSSYDLFNNAAKSLEQQLESLGAKKFHPTAFGDEAAKEGLQANFQPWMTSLWKNFATAGVEMKLPEDYSVALSTETATGLPLQKGFFKAVVSTKKQLSAASHPSQVHFLQLDVGAARVQYEIFGHILVKPQNATALVNRALSRLGLEGSQKVKINSEKIASPLNGVVVSVRDLLTQYLDITGVPSRAFFAGLSLCAENPNEKTTLEARSADMAPGNWYAESSAHGIVTLVDVLEEFQSVKISLGQLLTFCPSIKPRSYSTASDPESQPTALDICFSVPSRTIENKTFEGLATSHMRNLNVGDNVVVSVGAGAFSAPPDTAPAAAFVLGTGIAMARALAQRRALRRRNGVGAAPLVVYYGFNNLEGDFLFRDEWEQYEKQGVVKLIYTCARDQAKFLTPLDSLEADPSSLCNVLFNGGYFLYCGLGGPVPKLVQEGVRRAVAAGGNADSWGFVKTLKSQGKYQEEHFSRDVDAENAMEKLFGREGDNVPMAQRYDSPAMFCMQCEQTFQGRGCSTVGVCGKTPETANIQDLLVHCVKVLSFYVHNLKLIDTSASTADAKS